MICLLMWGLWGFGRGLLSFAGLSHQEPEASNLKMRIEIIGARHLETEVICAQFWDHPECDSYVFPSWLRFRLS